MNCQYSMMSLSPDYMAAGLFPEDILKQAGLDGWYFAAYSGGTKADRNTIGGAVVTCRNMPAKTARLVWIVVAEDYRERGVASGLLRFLTKELKNKDYRILECRLPGEEAFVAALGTFFMAQDFAPLYLTTHKLTYPLSQMLSCEEFAALPEKVLCAAIQREAVPGQALRAFSNQMARQCLFFHKTVYDVEYSRFYMSGKTVQGCILLTEVHDGVFEATLEFLMDKIDALAVPALLAGCIRNIEGKYGGDALFSVELYRPHLVDAFRKLFGEPEEDIFIQKYVRVL